MQGGNRRLRPVAAGIAVLVVLAAALYALDAAGGHVDAGHVAGAAALALLAGVVVA